MERREGTEDRRIVLGGKGGVSCVFDYGSRMVNIGRRLVVGMATRYKLQSTGTNLDWAPNSLSRRGE